ncbi:MAG TPA: DUF2520 domain-containing protein [Flavobacteriaceae bacterium]|nr:DUF2520 domain-containing protein [Flavobacteriaceae bacterium]
MIKVVILGAGNIASHFVKVFCSNENIVVLQWYNRTLPKVSSSLKKTIPVTDTLQAITKDADVYVMAIADDAIEAVSAELPFENKLVVHTAGSVSIHKLDKKLRRGVFYPLQTFTKAVDINFKNVPICIEALEKEDYKLLEALAKHIGSPVYPINTEQRQTLHLAAVFVNNFTNQLYRIAHELVDAKQIPFDILKPLIAETANKINTLSPYMAQTGPAKRNDKKTIKQQLKLLENSPHKSIYEVLTQSIKKTHGR